MKVIEKGWEGGKWLAVFWVLATLAIPSCAKLEAEPGTSGDYDKDPLSNPVLYGATKKFGTLYVRDGYYEKTAKVMPWSSYWYPFTERSMFESTPGGNSPLEKYDAWVRKVHGEDAGAARFEEDRIFDSHAQGWEGRCNAWSVASITRPEPKANGPVDGISFTVGDLKALLIKTYELTQGTEVYGQPFNENRRDSVFDDIFPDQFHRLMQVQLFDKGLPFIFDRDPGTPVWNFPVYKAQTRLTRDGSDARVMHVRTAVAVADDLNVAPDFQGTATVWYTYTYDLYGDPQVDGSLRVTRGQWTFDSVEDHPDYVTIVPDSFVRKSLNENIKIAYVDEILAKALKASASPATIAAVLPESQPAAQPATAQGGMLSGMFGGLFGRH